MHHHRVNILSTQLRSISRFPGSVCPLQHSSSHRGRLLCWLLTPLALPAFEFYVDGITWKVFWVCTLFAQRCLWDSSMMCVKCNSLFLFMDFILWLCQNLFMHSAVDGHLGCFHLRLLCIVLLWTFSCGFVGKHVEVGACAGVNAEVALSSSRSFCQVAFQVVAAVFTPTSSVCSARYSTSFPTLDIIYFILAFLVSVLWYQIMVLIAFPCWPMMLSHAYWLFEYSLYELSKSLAHFSIQLLMFSSLSVLDTHLFRFMFCLNLPLFVLPFNTFSCGFR